MMRKMEDGQVLSNKNKSVKQKLTWAYHLLPARRDQITNSAFPKERLNMYKLPNNKVSVRRLEKPGTFSTYGELP